MNMLGLLQKRKAGTAAAGLPYNDVRVLFF
jgi:hypothetical protein